VSTVIQFALPLYGKHPNLTITANITKIFVQYIYCSFICATLPGKKIVLRTYFMKISRHYQIDIW